MADLRLALAPKNRVAYVGWVGHGNMGDEAIFDVCRRHLPGYRLQQVPSGASFDRAASISRRPLLTGALLGGGTFVGRYAKYRRPFERWLATYPELPAFALGVGVADPGYEHRHGFDVSSELAAWREVLSRFRVVTVRGPRSQEILADAGIDSVVVGDPGLLVGSPEDRAPVREGLLGVNVGASARESHVDWARVLDQIAEAGRVMVSRGWRIRLIPVWGNDVQHARTVAAAIGGNVEIANGWQLLPSLLRSIGECEMFVGVKLHSVVFASALGVPSLMLEYEPKCTDFQRSIGRERDCLPVSDLRAGAIVDHVTSMALDGGYERERMIADVAHKRNELRQTVESIRRHLSTAAGQTGSVISGAIQ